MDWTNDMVIEFLQVIETHPIIWDPKHPDHRKKLLLCEAWRRIYKTVRWPCTIEDLKKKRESLMAYYRIHLYKIRKLRAAGVSEDEYKTNWFAFDTMHSFLGDIYDSSVPYNPEDISIEKNQSIPESTDSANCSEYQSDSEYQPLRKRIAKEIIVEDERRPEKRVNECEMYVQLLVHKLMKLDEDDRLVLMNKIDNLVFETTMEVNARKKSDERAAALHNMSSNHASFNNTVSIDTDPPVIIISKVPVNVTAKSPTQESHSQIKARVGETSHIVELNHEVEIKQEM